MKNKSKQIVLMPLLGTALLLTACGGKHEKIRAQAAKDAVPAAYVQGQDTLKIAQSFLEAAGKGDGETLNTLMADDFVWHNEGDPTIPWIGNWEGKQVVFEQFMPEFGKGLNVTSWTTDHSFASGDQAVFMGTMSAIATNTDVNTGVFSWAVRVQVQDGKVKSWNWFEDSFAVSQAYHADQN